VDGTLASTNPSVTTGQSFTGYWKIGCGNLTAWSQVPGTGDSSYNGPSYFTGQIQYAAIYSVALTAADVRAHYLAGLPSS
jgi:hypothetical protein